MGAVPDPSVPTTPYPKALRRFPRLRQSLLAAFDDCALTSKFNTELRVGWSTHPQARGQIFHRFAGRCLRELVAQNEREMDVGVALAILNEVLRQEDVDRVCPTCGTREIRPGLSKRGFRACAKGHRFETDLVNLPMAQVRELYIAAKKWAHDNVWPIENLATVEQRLEAVLEYPSLYGPVPRVLTGQIDALFIEGEDNERAVVYDWKDTWGMPAQTEISHPGYFQQRFYAWLVMRNFKGIHFVTLREQYPRYSETREATLSRDELDELELELAALAERFDRSYEEQAHPPSPGKHCAWCLRPSACPILPEARGEGRITNLEDAKRKAGQWIVAKESAAQLMAALKAFCDIHGPVPVRHAKGRRMVGFQRSVAEVKPTLAQVKQAEVLKQPISTLYKRRISTRFGDYTPRPEDSEQAQDAKLVRQLERSLEAAKASHPELDEVPF